MGILSECTLIKKSVALLYVLSFEGCVLEGIVGVVVLVGSLHYDIIDHCAPTNAESLFIPLWFLLADCSIGDAGDDGQTSSRIRFNESFIYFFGSFIHLTIGFSQKLLASSHPPSRRSYYRRMIRATRERSSLRGEVSR